MKEIGLHDKTAAIIINDRDWGAGKPCASYRVDTQCIPSGYWVAGFLVENEGDVDGFVCEPAWLPEWEAPGVGKIQHENFWAVVEEARKYILSDRGEEIEPGA